MAAAVQAPTTVRLCTNTTRVTKADRNQIWRLAHNLPTPALGQQTKIQMAHVNSIDICCKTKQNKKHTSQNHAVIIL